MLNRISQLRSVLCPRDFAELAANALVIIVFSVFSFNIPYPVSRMGGLIIIGGALFASWKIVERRRRNPRPDAVAPGAHEAADGLHTVRWWYTLSLLLGANVFYWGFPSRTLADKLVYTGVTVLIGASSYWLNERTRRKQLNVDALSQMESQAGKAAERPSAPSAALRRRAILIASGLVLAGVCATILLAWNSRERVLSAPGFDDVSTFNNSAVARINLWLQEQVALGKYPSLSVAIVREDKIVYQGAFGFENLKAHRNATPETSYHVASVTKAFTASIAVMLHARGVIDLDQPVAKYLPKDVSISTRPEVGAKITLRQLASHTSGLPRSVPGAVQSVEGRYQLEPNRLYDQLRKARLEYEPGAGQLYSNLGFGLLGHVLERAAGKPFDQLLREMVCDPLHLERTAIEDDKLQVATGYGSFIPRLEAKHSYKERFASSGGLIASAPDLAQFLSAQMKPGIFSSEMLEQLQTPSKLSDGSMARTALGWTVRSNASVGPFLEKNGGRDNCSAWIGFARGVGVAVVANCGEPSVDPIGRWLLERSVPGNHKPATK